MNSLLWKLHWYISKKREYPAIINRLTEMLGESQLDPITWQTKQKERLHDLLIYARDKVPYYQHLFRQVSVDVGSSDLSSEMKKIPILTKDIIRDNIDRLISRSVDRTKISQNATGGSTGVPLTFFQDHSYSTVAEASDAYVKGWWGIQPFDRTASIWGADREFHELTRKERLYMWRSRSRSLNAFRMTDQNLLAFCKMLLKWKPPYLMGYSTALTALARCAQDNHISNLTFKAIRSTAETLWPSQRKLIEETFNCPVYNFYGSREVNNLAAECPERRRLHLISTWRYVEIVDEAGKDARTGTPGSILVTDLSNYAMPFIRYCNEDIGCWAIEQCQCGRPSPVIEELLGRSADLIRTPSGGIIHGEFFTHLFYGRNDIARFQVHQTSIDRLVVRYEPIGSPPERFMKSVAERIRARLGSGVEVELEACNRIPVPPSGKHRFTISDLRV